MRTKRTDERLTFSTDPLTIPSGTDALQAILAGTVRAALQTFWLDREAAGLSPKTTKSYRDELGLFLRFCEESGVHEMQDLTPDHVRRHLLDMGTHRNPGGVHLQYRYIRVFCRFWEAETGLPAVTRKVKAPRYHPQPLPGVPLQDVKKMIGVAQGRDKVALMMLLDTGVRASELLALNIGDLNLMDGSVQIRHGKGDRRRQVWIGKNTRRVLRQYLITRQGLTPKSPLFVTPVDCRLQYEGLRQLVIRRAKEAKVPVPELHDFRRCHAITMLRAGVDLLTVARGLGHSDLSVIKRYCALLDSDVQRAHQAHGPVDNLL